jgi:DNA-directed RNA polymerase subunit RPC12/RpoP
MCSKSYLHEVDLKLHLLEHDELKYGCLECDQKYSTKAKLKNHVNRCHEGNEKKFKCNICDMAFNLKGNLRKHEITHTGEKHFFCTTCGKKFPRKAALLCHVLTHKTREFECKDCGRAFTDAKNLERHLKVHQSSKEFSCSECGLSGSRKDNLIRHVRNFHPTIEPPSKGVMVHKNLELSQQLRTQAKECTKKTVEAIAPTISDPKPEVNEKPIDNRVSVIKTIGNVKPLETGERQLPPQPTELPKKVEKKIDNFEIYRRILQPDADDGLPSDHGNEYPDFFKRRETRRETTTSFNFSKVHWKKTLH